MSGRFSGNSGKSGNPRKSRTVFPIPKMSRGKAGNQMSRELEIPHGELREFSGFLGCSGGYTW
jgi:hypothetical protein